MNDPYRFDRWMGINRHPVTSEQVNCVTGKTFTNDRLRMIPIILNYIMHHPDSSTGTHLFLNLCLQDGTLSTYYGRHQP
ncbi:MAG: hypothetical protein ACTSVZ_01970 [Promethearchaeota archaeon]